MSGIAGILQVDGRGAPADHLERMGYALRHRAPDGLKIVRDGPVGLVHALMVVDETTFRPLSSDGVSMVMDGRIDNVDVISRAAGRGREGSARGHEGFPRRSNTAASSADLRRTTEGALAAAYRQFEWDLPKWLFGDFALAVWDGPRGRLMLARDPLGVKPLFYYRDGRRFIFASEAKAILAVPGVPCRPSELKMAEYERFKFRALENSFFEGIRRVLPGERMRVEEDRLRCETYWVPPHGPPMGGLSESAWLSRFRKVFVEGVRRRIPKEGNVVFTLSGGLDSTSIAAAASHVAQGEDRSRLHTQSVVFGAFENEREHFGPAAACLKLPNAVVDADDIRPTDHLDRLAVELESPFVEVQDPNLYVGMFGAAAKRGARRVFTGFWGDQMMAGMSFLGDLIRAGRPVEFYREIRRIGESDVGNWRAALMRALRYLLLPNTGGPVFPTCNQRELYGSLFGCYHTMTLESFDMGAAYQGVEVCFPFLDRRLVELVFRMPAGMRIRAGVGKRLLREGLRGILPERTAARRSKAVATAFWANKLAECGYKNGTPGGAMRLWRAAARNSWEEAWFKSGDARRAQALDPSGVPVQPAFGNATPLHG
ncbi:MAG: hypothetical protein HYT87_04735 [Nitrospirae bacterium]|nr:hypothetical protein [Nitrospirota bacterium]